MRTLPDREPRCGGPDPDQEPLFRRRRAIRTIAAVPITAPAPAAAPAAVIVASLRVIRRPATA